MATIIDKILEDLNKKYKYAKLITDLSKKMTPAIRDTDDVLLKDLVIKRGKVMRAIDALNKSIQNYVNSTPPNARTKLIHLLNSKEIDANSNISKTVRIIRLEMKRSYTIDVENRKLLKNKIGKK